MNLVNLSLQNFRSYKKLKLTFSKQSVIIGPNTVGKTNILEAISLLSLGKSFRAEKEIDVIKFNEDLARVKGSIQKDNQTLDLEVVISSGQFEGTSKFSKKYLVNGVGKRRVDFSANLLSVIFAPNDLEIVVGSPSLRRNFLDDILEQTDYEYRVALATFTKGLRQRNALLSLAREKGIRNEKQFEYWDKLLIENGEKITHKRGEFVAYLNTFKKDIFDFAVIYDKSIISKERLLQYKDAEVGSGVTLVGPHRDDLSFSMFDEPTKSTKEIKSYGSRGQQRLVILQLKLLELEYIGEKTGYSPILLLDDVFSELDEDHIGIVLEASKNQQTIITTTHKELIPKKFLSKMNIIEL
ncbi:DNA replication and repair protein RecF [Patescibacteria group bacterium]|nr:DNA replication and repair protein RecF [Patescibacteria group bacterium]